MQVWRNIPTYNGLYKISNYGNVVSLQTGERRLLKPQKINGYLNVTLCNNGVKKSIGIHRLLWWAFKGLLSNKQNQIDHVDNVKTNNKLGNLQLLTSRENTIKSMDKTNSIGVSSVRNKFRARISVNGKSKHLGYFDTYDQAKHAYDKCLTELKQA